MADGKATVYRIFALVDRDIGTHAGDPASAVAAIFEAVAADVGRRDFRGCAFHNASIEFPDPSHPARAVARDYRAGLLERLEALAEQIAPGDARLADRLALVIDGMYVSGVHLGPDGPAAAGPSLAAELVERLSSP